MHCTSDRPTHTGTGLLECVFVCDQVINYQLAARALQLAWANRNLLLDIQVCAGSLNKTIDFVAEYRPNVIFLDVELPALVTASLFSVVQRLTPLMGNTTQLVLMGSAWKRAQVGADLMAMGNDRFHVLDKPFTLRDFKAIMQHAARNAPHPDAGVHP